MVYEGGGDGSDCFQSWITVCQWKGKAPEVDLTPYLLEAITSCSQHNKHERLEERV